MLFRTKDLEAIFAGQCTLAFRRWKKPTVKPGGTVRTQLGTLLLGYSYRLSGKRTLNVSLGAGLTRDTPDVSLSVRIPTTY